MIWLDLRCPVKHHLIYLLCMLFCSAALTNYNNRQILFKKGSRMKSEWCWMNNDWCGQSAWAWMRLDRKGIFVVIIIIQCASLHDGHAGLEMGWPSSPLLKPFRGLLPSYCAKGAPICNHLPLHNKWEEDSKVISQQKKMRSLLNADILVLMLESYNISKVTNLLTDTCRLGLNVSFQPKTT